jgi:3'(2'), 5'-bisphosphate nucleotidase
LAAADLQALLPRVVTLAEEAGEAIMALYDRPDPGTTYKSDDSPLTQADLASHRLLVDGLRALTPDWPVLSEESQAITYEQRRLWTRYWLVDPLDGTKEFLKHRDEFTVNVALIDDGAPIIGVVHAPALNVTYAAGQGMGATKRQGRAAPAPIRVGDYRAGGLKMAVSRSHAGGETDELVRKLKPIECVSVGSSLKLCLVAEGAAHLYPRFGPTMEWDIAAAQCVVEEAGGSVTDLEGRPLRYNKLSLGNPHFIVCGAPPFPWKEYLS